MYYVIVNRAAHDGHMVEMNPGNIWTNQNPHGWAYQDICGAHGNVLMETNKYDEAKAELDEWLKCDSVKNGTYCYTHNRIR